MALLEGSWVDDFNEAAKVAHFCFEVRGATGAVTRRLFIPNQERMDLRAIGGFDPSGVDSPKVVPRIDRNIRRRLAETLGLGGHFSLLAQCMKALDPIAAGVLYCVEDEIT